MTLFRFFGRFLFLLVAFLLIFPEMAIGQDCSYEVFSDEFNYEGEPNPDHWNYETGGGGWGNKEKTFGFQNTIPAIRFLDQSSF